MPNHAIELSPDQKEAYQLIVKLTEMKDSLSISDRRFLQGWHRYLLKRKQDFRVGIFRLQVLRNVAKAYQIDVPTTKLSIEEEDYSGPNPFESLPLQRFSEE